MPLSGLEVEQLVNVFVKRVGARIRELREMQGLVFATIRDEHEINISSLSRIENGKQNLTIHSAVRIAFALGIQPYELYVPREISEIRPKRRRRKPPSPAAFDKAKATFRKQIGARIRELRELRGMSMMTIEGFSGIEYQTLRRIEIGVANIRASTAVRIADAIGVQPHELYVPREMSGIRPKSPAESDDDA